MSADLSTSEVNTKTTRKATNKSNLKSTQRNTSIVDVNAQSNAEKSITPHIESKNKSPAAENAEYSKEEIHQNDVAASTEDKQEVLSTNNKKKLKCKKRKGHTNRQNISLNSQGDKEINCHICTKPVYKMEEIMAEKNIYHKNCFRCHECNKQLKVDNYLSHEGILYCVVHFKLLFSPKFIEDAEPDTPRQPELIIRENHPIQLPPDVIRASDKPDLGLEELQQLNVRSRFQVFENAIQIQKVEHSEQPQRSTVKRSLSILSRIAKLNIQGVISDLSLKVFNERQNDNGSDGHSSDNKSYASAENEEDGNEYRDADLVFSKKRTQKEQPVGLGNSMHDIKRKFENEHIMSKEERREERKQEIQNIRSRLFLGKQARIKEMYQQAVAESEHGITSSVEKPKIEIEGAARSLKERFECGEIFMDTRDSSAENICAQGRFQRDTDVFESAISKKSRRIFMELDANNSPKYPNVPFIKRHPCNSKRQNSENDAEDVVKCDEKPEDIEIETSEISSKFKFFETYRPAVLIRKPFRITPPREGVVKMPNSEFEIATSNDAGELGKETHVLEKSRTTAIMLKKFREMEQNRFEKHTGPRPLKCFTPPPDGDVRFYQDADSSDQGSQDENEEFEDDDEDEDCESSSEHHKRSFDDEALREAQAAARAKQLRAKFEKWEAKEKEREANERRRLGIYSNEVPDTSNIESTKSIRERFEKMKISPQQQQQTTRPRYKVNRFV